MSDILQATFSIVFVSKEIWIFWLNFNCSSNWQFVADSSDNGWLMVWRHHLKPLQHQAIAWTNDDLIAQRTHRNTFNQILFQIQTFSFEKCIWKCLPFYFGFNGLNVTNGLNGLNVTNGWFRDLEISSWDNRKLEWPVVPFTNMV